MLNHRLHIPVRRFFFDAFKIAVNPELTVFVRDIFLVSGNFGGLYDFKGLYITFAELQDAAVFIADSDIDGSGDLLKVKMSQQFVDEFRCCRSAGAFCEKLATTMTILESMVKT